MIIATMTTEDLRRAAQMYLINRSAIAEDKQVEAHERYAAIVAELGHRTYNSYTPSIPAPKTPQADKELPGSAAEVRRLIRALRVIVLTPHIRAYLTANDPMALRQALTALSAYIPVESTAVTPKPYCGECDAANGRECHCYDGDPQHT